MASISTRPSTRCAATRDADQAHHRPPGPRQAIRRRHEPRADRAPPGQMGDQGRHRLHQHQHLLRQCRRRDQVGAAVDRQGHRRQAARLCRRSPLQPGRPARPGGRRQRRLPRQRRDRVAARPREGRYRALLCAAGRHGPRPAGDRAGRRRHGLRVGDRRRSAAGSPPRTGDGREELRQGLGADRRPDRSGKRFAADHGALLHAVGSLGSGGRDRPRHHRARSSPTPTTRIAASFARPIFADTCLRRPRSRTSCWRPTTRRTRASP